MKKISILLLSASLAMGCSREELSPNSVVDANAVERNNTELDEWIKNNITQPYGIEVSYRWKGTVAQQESYTYPANPENVKKVLETIKYLWLETYTLSTTGKENFMKEKNPIRIYLYGGQNIDSRGVELINNPESVGAEMYIYNVNDFDPGDTDKVYILMRSVHHQFAKRLAESIPYDRDAFLTISKKRYTFSTQNIAAVLSNISSRRNAFGLNGYANKQGFFTIHSFLNPEDDFAEVVSVMFTSTPREIANALTTAATPYTDPDPDTQLTYNEEARAAYSEMTQKKKFVEDYFNNSVKINISRMQLASVQRMIDFVNNN